MEQTNEMKIILAIEARLSEEEEKGKLRDEIINQLLIDSNNGETKDIKKGTINDFWDSLGGGTVSKPITKPKESATTIFRSFFYTNPEETPENLILKKVGESFPFGDFGEMTLRSRMGHPYLLWEWEGFEKGPAIIGPYLNVRENYVSIFDTYFTEVVENLWQEDWETLPTPSGFPKYDAGVLVGYFGCDERKIKKLK